MKKLPVLIRSADSVAVLPMSAIPAVGEAINTGRARFIVTGVTHLVQDQEWDPVAEVLVNDVTPQRPAEQPVPEQPEQKPTPNRKTRRATKKEN